MIDNDYYVAPCTRGLENSISYNFTGHFEFKWFM